MHIYPLVNKTQAWLTICLGRHQNSLSIKSSVINRGLVEVWFNCCFILFVSNAGSNLFQWAVAAHWIIKVSNTIKYVKCKRRHPRFVWYTIFHCHISRWETELAAPISPLWVLTFYLNNSQLDAKFQANIVHFSYCVFHKLETWIVPYMFEYLFLFTRNGRCGVGHKS